MTTDAKEGPCAAAERGAVGGITALLVSGMDGLPALSDDPFIEANVTVRRVSGLDAAEAVCARGLPELVFLPVGLDGRSARGLLERILAARPQPVVVVIASNDQINAAAEAMRSGAFDCLFRPFSTQRLTKTLDAALAALPAVRRPAPRAERFARDDRRPPRQATAPDGHSSTAPAPDRLIFTSPEMRSVIGHVDAVAQSDAPVFIIGAHGTGKDLVARRLHEHSCRADGAFVTVECAALTPVRAEAVLSGPEGVLARAAAGTLYLEEIGDLDPNVQPQLLRLIEAARAAGDNSHAPRLVAGTRHDPRELIRSGRLRPELFYRLHVAPITLPPLSARPADIAAIATEKLGEFSGSEGRRFAGFSDDALALLRGYEWPGNVRELINVIWSVVVMHEGPLVMPEMLPSEIAAPAPRFPRPAPSGLDDLVGMTLDEIEQAVIEATIRAEGGSVPRAARVLDISPSTIYRKREAWAKKP